MHPTTNDQRTNALLRSFLDPEAHRSRAQREVERAMTLLQVALAAAEGSGEITPAQLRAPARALRKAWDALDVLRGELSALRRVDEADGRRAQDEEVQP